MRDATLWLCFAVLCGACNGEPTLEEVWGGEWSVEQHEEAPSCGDYGPADPAWSGLEIAFVDLQGFLGVTVARCEGGCDVPSAAVALDVADEEEISGLDTESGLFNSIDGDFCQVSMIELIATRKADSDEMTLELRSFFGGLDAPADGDCQALVDSQTSELCDVSVRFEATR